MLQQLFIILALGVVLSFFNTPVFAETYDDEEMTLSEEEDEDFVAPISEENTRKKIPWRLYRMPLKDDNTAQEDQNPITVNTGEKIDISADFKKADLENASKDGNEAQEEAKKDESADSPQTEKVEVQRAETQKQNNLENTASNDSGNIENQDLSTQNQGEAEGVLGESESEDFESDEDYEEN